VSKKARAKAKDDDWYFPVMAYADVEARIAEMIRGVAAGRTINRVRCHSGGFVRGD
jgi:hypothetical protein